MMLLPCPFCGSESLQAVPSHNSHEMLIHPYISCNDCGCDYSCEIGENGNDDFSGWNKRVNL